VQKTKEWQLIVAVAQTDTRCLEHAISSDIPEIDLLEEYLKNVILILPLFTFSSDVYRNTPDTFNT